MMDSNIWHTKNKFVLIAWSSKKSRSASRSFEANYDMNVVLNTLKTKTMNFDFDNFL